MNSKLKYLIKNLNIKSSRTLNNEIVIQNVFDKYIFVIHIWELKIQKLSTTHNSKKLTFTFRFVCYQANFDLILNFSIANLHTRKFIKIISLISLIRPNVNKLINLILQKRRKIIKWFFVFFLFSSKLELVLIESNTSKFK